MARAIWDMWDFKEVEIDLRDHARENGLEYDERHPLSILPGNAAKKALDAIGGTYAEIAELMPANIKTVSGWFAPGRKPSRSVVAHNIIPALCEMYVRHTNANAFRFIFDQGEYISEGKRPSKSYTLMVQGRVFLLLTTGLDVNDEDRAKSMARSLDIYHRGVIRYAAAYLDDDELASVASAALNALVAHANRPSSDKQFPDDITGMYRRNTWFFYAGSSNESAIFPDTLETSAGDQVKPDPDDYPYFAGVKLGSSADHHHISDMSNANIEHYIDYMEEVLNRREAEEAYYEQHMREQEQAEADER